MGFPKRKRRSNLEAKVGNPGRSAAKKENPFKLHKRPSNKATTWFKLDLKKSNKNAKLKVDSTLLNKMQCKF
jgi:hypothetical protein